MQVKDLIPAFSLFIAGGRAGAAQVAQTVLLWEKRHRRFSVVRNSLCWTTPALPPHGYNGLVRLEVHPGWADSAGPCQEDAHFRYIIRRAEIIFSLPFMFLGGGPTRQACARRSVRGELTRPAVEWISPLLRLAGPRSDPPGRPSQDANSGRIRRAEILSLPKWTARLGSGFIPVGSAHHLKPISSVFF